MQSVAFKQNGHPWHMEFFYFLRTIVYNEVVIFDPPHSYIAEDYTPY